ncbi:glycerol-3-phosphate acyltransferase, partial [Streptococcus sobrinus]
MESIIFIIIAYLLGSIPSGLWIGQIFYHKNIRDYGSGNTGTT